MKPDFCVNMFPKEVMTTLGCLSAPYESVCVRMRVCALGPSAVVFVSNLFVYVIRRPVV